MLGMVIITGLGILGKFLDETTSPPNRHEASVYADLRPLHMINDPFKNLYTKL